MTELLGEELWSTALSQPKDGDGDGGGDGGGGGCGGGGGGGGGDHNDDDDDLPSGEVNIHHFSPTLRGITVLLYTTQVYFLQMMKKIRAKQSGKPLYFAWR